MSFKGKVAVVTGAGSGIGATIAEEFAREGASVVMVDLTSSEAKLKDVAQRCAAQGPEPLLVLADVTDDVAATSIIQQTITRYNRLDILVNCAGIAHLDGVLSDKIMEAYDRTMNVNLRAIVHLTNLAAPHLIETKGNIINLSSIAGIHAGTSSITYMVSKAALIHFTSCIALKLSSHGVRVNAICPGPVLTDILTNNSLPATWDQMKAYTALKKVSLPKEVADLVTFLASDKAKSITGTKYVIDNGMLLNFL